MKQHGDITVTETPPKKIPPKKIVVDPEPQPQQEQGLVLTEGLRALYG